MIKIAVNGAEGRMGSRILALAGESPKDFKVTGRFLVIACDYMVTVWD